MSKPPITADPPKTVLLDMEPVTVEKSEIFQDLATHNATGGISFKNGQHQTSPKLMAVYESYLPKIQEALAARGMTVEDDVILSKLAALDGNKELSKEELAAGIMALDAFPNANKDGKGVVMGMEMSIRPEHYQRAVDHAAAFIATAKQFLGDHYKVDVQGENTRSPESDKAYVDLIRQTYKSIQKDNETGKGRF